MTSNLLKTLTQAPLWLVCGAQAQGAEAIEARGAVVIRAPSDRPDVGWVAQELAARGQTRVLIESGPQVATAFLEASLVDEIAWFRAPRTLGPGSEPAFHGNWLEKLAFERQAVLQAGPDLLELYSRKV